MALRWTSPRRVRLRAVTFGIEGCHPGQLRPCARRLVRVVEWATPTARGPHEALGPVQQLMPSYQSKTPEDLAEDSWCCI
jgi:hypothetical protein